MRLAIYVTCMVSLLAPAATAQRESCDASPSQIPTLLTVEGGGSLGVYEAGMTYSLVETFKRKWLGERNVALDRLAPLCLSIATGASAGSINAFIAATSWCDARTTAAPEQSMLWRTWVTTGIMQLLPFRGEKPSHDSAVFARRHFDSWIEPELRKAWAGAQWVPGCHVEFGATATRLYADSLKGIGAIGTRNQRMAFALTVRGIDRAKGEPEVHQFFPETRMQRGSFGSLNTLPGVQGRVAWSDVFKLLKTSSAFPVAFEPLELEYCTYNEEIVAATLGVTCGHRAQALDGGVFDNAPLSLSYLLAFSHNLKTTATTMLFLSPDRRREWPGSASGDRLRAPGRTGSAYGLQELTQLVGEMIPTARQYELQIAGRVVPMELFLRMSDFDKLGVLQQGSAMPGVAGGQPSVAHVAALLDRNFRATARWHPLTGDWLGGFGAFLGRPMREYDFYVGMYDANVLLAENLLCQDDKLRLYVERKGPDVGYRDCVKREVEWLIHNPPLPVGPVATRVMLALHHDEFLRPKGASARPRAVGARLFLPDSQFVVVDGVREALYQARVANARPPRHVRRLHPDAWLMHKHCVNPGLVNGLFCNNGVVAFFDLLHDDTQAFRILYHWSGAEDCSVKHAFLPGTPKFGITNAWERPENCRVERSFAKAGQDPEGQLYELSRQVLSRLEERTPPKGAPGKATGALLYAHATVGDRHRRYLDIGRSTIPVDAKWRPFWYALPSSWALTPNIRGWGEIGWEARRHIHTWPLALSFPLRVRPLSQIGTENQIDRTLIVPGVRLEHKALPLATRAGVQTDFWMRPSDGFEKAYRGQTTGTFVSLAGKVNITFTPIPRGLPAYRRQNSTILTIGTTDLNGLAYWLFGKQ